MSGGSTPPVAATARGDAPWPESMRTTGDPPADEAIRAVVEMGQVDAVNRVMRTLIENDDFPTADLPEAVAGYMADTSHLPVWADLDQLEAASELFERYGPEIVLMLFGASLPTIYAAHPACEVLAGTRRMTKHIHRRIIETGQFVIDVTEPDAWAETGRGVLTCQKVRLMHATIRHYLTRHDAWRREWRPEWGTPICQEDLLGTMLSFSVTVLQSLEKSKITVTADEREAYVHLWTVVGYLLGIDEGILPKSYAEAEAWLEHWKQRNHHPTETSVHLMTAMVDFWYERVPGRIFDGITSGWCRLWIGHELADRLQVPPFDWTRNILRVVTTLWGLEDRLGDYFGPARWVSRFWKRKLMQALLVIERDGQRPDFRVPDRLKHAWGLGH